MKSEEAKFGSEYVLGDRIGRGAVGTVHRAVRGPEAEPVAIKLLRADLAEDPKTVARFVQERSALGRIRHPHVVEVLDLVVEGDRLGIVMELVAGGDLRSRVEQGAMMTSEVLSLVADVAVGLAALHEAGIVHKDVKPENVLLTEGPNPVPKLSDFGISEILSDTLTRTSRTIGTPLYMAPEQLSTGPVGSPADVYALGVVLYELLDGKPPFHVGGTMAILHAHSSVVPPRLARVTAPVADLVAEMLNKNPQQRPDASSVQARLTALADGSHHRHLPLTSVDSKEPMPMTALPLEEVPNVYENLEPEPPTHRRFSRVALLSVLSFAAASVLVLGSWLVLSRQGDSDEADLASPTTSSADLGDENLTEAVPDTIESTGGSSSTTASVVAAEPPSGPSATVESNADTARSGTAETTPSPPSTQSSATAVPATTAVPTTQNSETTEVPGTTEAPTTETPEPTDPPEPTEPVTPPIAVVSGPSVLTKSSTELRFVVTTNNVCGTASFTITEQGGPTVGSHPGAAGCYGPRHETVVPVGWSAQASHHLRDQHFCCGPTRQ